MLVGFSAGAALAQEILIANGTGFTIQRLGLADSNASGDAQDLLGNDTLSHVPLPSLRINAASVFTTIIDLVFLAMAWEYLGKRGFRLKLWLRAFLTLLGLLITAVL